MSHALGSSAAANRDRLVAVLGLSLVILVVEAVGAFASNSLALLADAGHMLTDVSGIGLALLAIWFAGRAPTNDRTFGYLRLEIVAAVTNAFLLFGVAAFILFEAWQRLSAPPEVASGLMLAVALLGLAANAVSLYLLRQAQREPEHARGLSRGHGRLRGLGGGHRRRGRHRDDRLEPGRRRGFSGHRPAHPAPDVRAPS